MRVAQSLKNTGDPVGAIEMSRRIVASCIADEQCDDRERAEGDDGAGGHAQEMVGRLRKPESGECGIGGESRQYGESHPATLVARSSLQFRMSQIRVRTGDSTVSGSL